MKSPRLAVASSPGIVLNNGEEPFSLYLMNSLLQNAKGLQALLAPPRKNGQYIYDLSNLKCSAEDVGNISIPINIDTEFKSFPKHWTEADFLLGRKGVTTQIRGIGAKEGRIYVHKGMDVKRHKEADSFHPISYLKDLGYDASLRRFEGSMKGMPKVEFVLYAHFALAEILLIVEGEYRQDLLNFFNEPSVKKPRFEMTRRLRAITPTRKGNYDGELDHIDLPWVLSLDGEDYAVSLSVIDTCAVHGQASYKELCEASGIKLDFKDNFSEPGEKEIMDEHYANRPDDFDAYSLGDLYPYDALVANSKNFELIYETLGVMEYFQPPRLTIGSTIRDLFMSVLFKKLGISSSDKEGKKFLVEKYLSQASAGSLRENARETSALLAKVEGGRCRNNRPLTVSLVQTIVDLDISGCYGEGQRNQEYFVGTPEIISYSANSDCNQYWTLRQFLKAYDGDLVPGAWFARVSTQKPLKYAQDFFASWFLPTGHGENIMAKYVAKMSSDTENEATDISFNEEDGSLKIFNHEILNGTLSHDGLEWILNIASPRQREELLDSLQVKAAMVYPASWRVNSYEELIEAHKNHTGKNTKKRVGKGKKQLRHEDGECHAWIGINLGDLLVNDLLANRKLYAKKTPLNTLYKLCVNTLYGDMTSKFFASANVVVGNNITARARSLAWYMEKGLNGFQTITDGCAFELEGVLYPYEGRSINGENVVNLYRSRPTDRQLRLAPLAGFESLTWLSVDKGNSKPRMVLEGITYDEMPMNLIDQKAMEHLQNLFPKVSVLHADSTILKSSKCAETGKAVKEFKSRKGQFSFEGKDFYDKGVFHGTSNYRLTNPNGENLKFRAYETKKKHESVNDALEVTDRYGRKNNPAKDLMNQLESTGLLARQVPFVKEAILKPSDYRNRQGHYSALNAYPGDSFYKAGLLREFSLSQMTFKTLKQYLSWEKAIGRNKERYGQSLEMFFLTPEGLLDYPKMVKSVDYLIDQDCLDPFAVLDPHRNSSRDLDKTHPSYRAWLRLKERLGLISL